MSGIVEKNFGQPGGGTQLFLLERGAEFSNPRPIDPSIGVFK